MNCPKCGGHISAFDLKPNCRHCGVNIMYFSQENELSRDAKRAELEFASARIFLAKIKSAFIGGALPIVRLILTFLLIGSFAVPVASVSFDTPIFKQGISIGAIGIYRLFSDGALTLIPDFAKSVLFASATKSILIVAIVYALALIVCLLLAAFEFLSFIDIKKTAKIMSVISIVGAVVSAVLAVFSFTLGSNSEFVSFGKGVGSFAMIICFAAYFVCNKKIAGSEIKFNLKEHDFERKELLKKVKKGEITLDELPLPVFETEKEKEERLKALEEALKTEEEGKEQ